MPTEATVPTGVDGNELVDPEENPNIENDYDQDDEDEEDEVSDAEQDTVQQ